jgi:hypothetical protein
MTPTTTLRNFRSITKFSYIGLPLNMREQLTANRTYYVAPSGSDSNNGLTVGTPFLTTQKAINTIVGTLDCQTYDVIIQHADGTYPGFSMNSDLLGSGTLFIQGNSGATSNVFFNGVGNTCQFSNVRQCVLRYCKVQSTSTWGIDVAVLGQSTVTMTSVNLQFSSSTCMGFYAAGLSVVYINGTSAMTGANGRAWMYATSGKFWVTGATISFSGTTWGEAGVRAGFGDGGGGAYFESTTLSGTAAGKRFETSGCGVINVLGQGVNYLPGNVAGTNSAGGQYY